MEYRRWFRDGIAAPSPSAMARYPRSWYIVCSSRSLGRGRLVRRDLCGRRLVVFRGRNARVGVLDARCSHLGADLGAGRVIGDRIECPYHRFRFDPHGDCAATSVRQPAYPTRERYGQIFAFLGDAPTFDLPAFDVPGGTPLRFASAFALDLRTDWFMVSANAFDLRHFNLSHARRLRADPVVREPLAHRCGVGYRFCVVGESIVDRITRRISGPEVDFDITVHGGNIVLVRTSFGRDRTYGMVVSEPCGSAGAPRVRVHIVVGAECPGDGALSRVRARWRAWVKRYAVHAMVSADINALDGLEYRPGGLQPGDEVLAGFLRWVAEHVQCAQRVVIEGVQRNESSQPDTANAGNSGTPVSSPGAARPDEERVGRPVPDAGLVHGRCPRPARGGSAGDPP